MDNIDQDLIKKVEKLIEISFEDKPESLLYLFEFFKQLIQESEFLLDELDDMEEVIIMQEKIFDKDFTYWIKLGKGEYDYGEGEHENKTCGFGSDWDTLRLMMAGKINGTRAYRDGKIIIYGDMQDAMAYGAYMGCIIMEITDAKKEKEKGVN